MSVCEEIRWWKFGFLMRIIKSSSSLPWKLSLCHFSHLHLLLRRFGFWFRNLSWQITTISWLYLSNNFWKQVVQPSLNLHIDLNETFRFFVLAFWLNSIVLVYHRCLMVFAQSWIWLLVFNFFFDFEMRWRVLHAD